jgi:hypothetical protein
MKAFRDVRFYGLRLPTCTTGQNWVDSLRRTLICGEFFDGQIEKENDEQLADHAKAGVDD